MPTVIDPTPQGWLYGFPKELPDDVEDVIGWLMENGYPEELAAYCKYKIWYVDEDSIDN
jgi:hypothetical protein